MSSDIDVVVAGHICVDVYPGMSGRECETFKKTFLSGRLISAGPFTFYPGGAMLNTGLTLHRLGISARLTGKVWNDLFGQAILRTIKTHGDHLVDGMQIDPSFWCRLPFHKRRESHWRKRAGWHSNTRQQRERRPRLGQGWKVFPCINILPRQTSP